jgi:phcA
MSKIVALLTDITSEGSVVLTQQTGAKLNGMPIATKGCKITYKGSPTDQPVEFASGVLLNGQPLTFVGAKTSAGTAIISTGKTTATIGQVKKEQPSVLQQEPLEQKQRKIVLKSTYPYDELYDISKQLSKSTFINLLTSFFEQDIPWKSYEDLYRRLRRDKRPLMPPIVVVEEHLKGNRYAAFNSDTESIEIRRSCVIQAVEGNKNKRENAKQLLLLALLEEYGHYIDHYLRNHCSKVGGDAKKDEGAVFSYYLTNYWITDKKIDFGTIEIDGVATPLSIDLSKVVQDFNELKKRIEEDQKEGPREFFTSGKKDSENSEYGHFDFIKVLERDKILNKYAICWIYLGNYLRDMSQVITPMLTALSKSDRALIDGVSPRILENKPAFLDSFLLSRNTWANVIEAMAANLIITEMGTELEGSKTNEPKILEDILKPSEVGGLEENDNESTTNTNRRSRKKKYKKILKDKGVVYGLKLADFAGKYVHFLKYFDEVTPELLGVSRTEEHIDNPLTAFTFDEKTKDYYYCPPEAKPSLTDVYGMKRYIRNESKGVEIPADDQTDLVKKQGKYASGLPTAVETMRKFFKEGVTTFKDKHKADKDRLLGLTDIGAALHILEDYFAHSNFCEILLIKLGVSVYPWVDITDAELRNYNNTQKPFEVKNILPKDNKDNIVNNDKSKNPYFEDIDELYTSLSEKGDCILLPSFEVKGVYFLFKPKEEKNYKLYLASYEGGKSTTSKKNTKVRKEKRTPILDNNVELFSKDFRLYIKNTLNTPLDCTPERKNTIQSYKGLRCHIADDNILDNKNSLYNHAQYIPVVTGFFATDDAVHSVLELINSIIEGEKTSMLPATLEIENDKKPVMLEISDLIIIYILRDLMLSQYEQNGVAIDTGENRASMFLKMYMDYVKGRDIFNKLYNFCKKYDPFEIPKEFFKKNIERINAKIKSYITQTFKDILETLAKTIVTAQNYHIDKISTNPTHSQLAKDEPSHPLHSLAGKLARHCIEEMTGIFEALASAESKYKTKEKREIILSPDDIAEMFIEKALSFMQHPCQTNWADDIALEWLYSSADNIQALHQHEYEFRNAKHTGKKAEEELKKLQASLNSAIEKIKITAEFVQDTCKTITEFIEKTENLIDKVGKEAVEKFNDALRTLEKARDEIQKKFKLLFEDEPNDDQILIKHNLEINIRDANERIAYILNELSPYTHSDNFSPTLQGMQKAFCQQESQKNYNKRLEMSDFESKMYDYLKVTSDKQYAKSSGSEEQYQQYCKNIFQKEQQYIAQTADYYINRIYRRSSLIVEPNKRNA